jgi:xanthine dehydrogenase YagR molybdenum-binding subunit
MSQKPTDRVRRHLLKSTAVVTAASGVGLRFGPAQAAELLKQDAKDQDNPDQKYQAIGVGRDRGDGSLKITGQATYAIEHQLDNVVYGVVIQSTISSGRITRMDTDKAKQAPGVLAVYTHQSGLKINKPTPIAKGGAAQSTYTPIQDDIIIHNGQNIGIVIAETFEQATYAASLVSVGYDQTPAILFAEDKRAQPKVQEQISINLGDARQAMTQAAVRINGTYTTPREYNMPMEPHACIAQWQDGKFTVWEPSQWVAGGQKEIAEWMGVDKANVHLVSPYVGGGFGSKPVPYTHVALACVAARELKRPVKVSLTRPQIFTGLGGRPATSQNIELGATRDGKIVSIIHESFNETSLHDVHVESCNRVTALMYAVPNVSSRHSVVPINTVTPGWMRAPGENPSAFGLETAMDEMAYALNLDPLELRLRNWADHDYQSNLPWTTRRLREAYLAGAKAFGWDKRNPAPRSMRDGHELIGWGMAAGTYPVNHQPAESRLTLRQDGTLIVQSAGADIGTGTYTILAQTAAEILRIPSETIKVQLGDTQLPRAGVAGGSQLAGNLTGALSKAASLMREQLISLAVEQPGSPLYQTARNRVTLADGQVVLAMRPGRAVSFGKLLQLAKMDELDVAADTFKPGTSQQDRDMLTNSLTHSTHATANGVSAHSWSAQFIEVRVDEDFGTVRVKRMVGAFDSGRLYNPKLARSQWIGGMIMGLGQALLEEGIIDPRSGRVINNNLADYLVAVNADVPAITTIDVGLPDTQATVLGGKAVGELGIVGVAAAISNAVYHATGKRVRDLPITLDKLT